MFRKPTEKSALVTLALGAALVTAPACAQTATKVIIQDAAGHQAVVIGGKLDVYDPVSDPLIGYSKDPKNFVDIFFNLFTSSCATNYTVPSGKALVVTALTGENIKSDTSATSAGYFLYNGASCSGTTVSAGGSSDVVSPINASFGTGIVIPTGGTLSFLPSNNSGYAYAHGYLIPASASPPAVTPSAADSAAIAAKMSKQRGK